jgi:hypothetical protein
MQGSGHRMHFSRPRRTGPGQPSPLLPPTCGGARLLDATPRQTCPRPRPRAQIAFKNSMIHGILQFTLSIAFRYVLHRNESRDIRCRESFHVVYRQSPRPHGGVQLRPIEKSRDAYAASVQRFRSETSLMRGRSEAHRVGWMGFDESIAREARVGHSKSDRAED